MSFENPHLASIALHECAHALAAEVQGIPYKGVVLGNYVLPDGTTVGGGLCSDPAMYRMIDCAVNIANLAVSIVAMSLISEAVDRRLSGLSAEDAAARSAADKQRMEDLLMRAGVSTVEYEAALAQGTRRVDEFLRNQQVVPALYALAEALISEPTRMLSREQIQQILKARGLSLEGNRTLQ